MKQATHTWIAIRAIKLLEDEGKAPWLADLLRPYASDAAVGAWMPDLTDARSGSAAIGNHVFKLEPEKLAADTQAASKRYVVGAKALTKSLGKERRTMAYVNEQPLAADDAWWARGYKADIMQPGQHLPNRAAAGSTTLVDMLLLGTRNVSSCVPGDIDFIDEVADESRTNAEQVALYFFMLSHYVADACMPCHCDARQLAGYEDGYLHAQWEMAWERLVGADFLKEHITGVEAERYSRLALSDRLLSLSTQVDQAAGLAFTGQVPSLVNHDVWQEMVNVCRASFALCAVVAPPGNEGCAYGGKGYKRLGDLFADDAARQPVDAVILHDAVLNVAMVWKHAWTQACGLTKAERAAKAAARKRAKASAAAAAAASGRT